MYAIWFPWMEEWALIPDNQELLILKNAVRLYLICYVWPCFLWRSAVLIKMLISPFLLSFQTQIRTLFLWQLQASRYSECRCWTIYKGLCFYYWQTSDQFAGHNVLHINGFMCYIFLRIVIHHVLYHHYTQKAFNRLKWYLLWSVL